eukprot:TRINITY_DN3760_c0_g1_i1.p1 TRINITY_DN3760_c0_g1~~TRINITY_DN3760_c0_g1_i1.p1  ORF type:complete len:328 (-),score=50.18 TRINITY_DN3760_c0_g1_i1:57-1040(-)
MPRVVVGGSRGCPFSLSYELHGNPNSKNKVIFIAGLLTSGIGAWLSQVTLFDTKLKEDYEICIFDNRGIGFSEVTLFGYSSSNMAMDAKDLLDHLGWEKFHLVGISMGGFISTELALACLGRVLSLTLAVTHSGGLRLGTIPPLSGLQMLAKISLIKDFELRATEMSKMLYSPGYLASKHIHPEEVTENSCKCNGTIQNRLVLIYAQRIAKEPPISLASVCGHLKAASTHYVSEKRLSLLRESGIPIAIMTGTHDHLVKSLNSHFLNKILVPKEFRVFESAGHLINDECEEEFNEIMLRNIQRGIERENSSGLVQKEDNPPIVAECN